MCNTVDTQAQTKIYRMIYNRNTTFLPCDKIIMAMTYSEYYRMLSASTRPLCNPHIHQTVSLQLTTEAAKAWRSLETWTSAASVVKGKTELRSDFWADVSLYSLDPSDWKASGTESFGVKSRESPVISSLFHFCTFLSNKYFWLNKGRKSPQLSSPVLSTFKVEAGGLLGVQGHPGPQSEILSKKISLHQTPL